MVVNIYGSLDDVEYTYGLLIKEMFDSDPELQLDVNNIHILTSVQCYGQRTEDIDIVIFGEMKNYRTDVLCEIYNYHSEIEMRDVLIKDFCMVVEVKKHDIENLSFQGSELLVEYKDGRQHNASQQNRNQMYSLVNHLDLKGSLNVSKCIFLPNVSTKQIPHDLHESVLRSQYLLNNSDIHDFWQCLLSQRIKPSMSREGAVFKSSFFNAPADVIQTCVNRLSKKIRPSHLDRLKMERISKRQLKDQRYEELLGKQLLIFRGKGGTGKTYRLLNMAHDLYEKYSSRTLILTYNNALVADIKRLLALMKISDGIGHSVQINTAHSFWWRIYSRFGIISDSTEPGEYDDNDYKRQLKEILQREGIDSELKRLSIEHPDVFSWDYIMVDEAQDWPTDERDLLYAIFGFKRIIIADGINQLIRSNVPCNWRDYSGIDSSNSQVVPLRTSLRQKPNLNRFVSIFSDEMGLQSWGVKDNDESYGGRVIIVEGDYTMDIHHELVESNREDSNENIDMLFCVPPNNIDQYDKVSSLGMMLEEHDCSIWDGTNLNTRKKTYPTNLDDFRIVQYDSCRGLEGWVSVNIDIDSFYEHKLNTYIPETGQQDFVPLEEKRKSYAGNWLLIPLTRAVDTLVINVKDRKGPLYDILKRIYETNDDYIEWRIFDGE